MKKKLLKKVNETFFYFNSYFMSEKSDKIIYDLPDRKIVKPYLNYPFKEYIYISDEDSFFNPQHDRTKIRRFLENRRFDNIYFCNSREKIKQKNIRKDENLIIKADNLVALNLLKNENYKAKLIYIDPPYNTKSMDIQYNDTFEHHTWLVFMQNRLEFARDILREDGSVWISISDEESHYLKVLCDEIFGRENFLANIIWEKKKHSKKKPDFISDVHEHILVYTKNKKFFALNSSENTVIKTLWYEEEVLSKNDAKKEVDLLLDKNSFSTPKPEKLIKKILQSATNKNDLVIDLFMGSATVPAVSLKMNRQFIGIENMDYIHTVSIPRIIKVIEGEQGGISKTVNWKGGGGFIYTEIIKN
ncbi:site-specific DNA-methyltransferase [Staphylococcus epidermidis]|uniref:site-specific DNA-methyltransferase n=1 Tax=Staphylococcus epidermidis TaxID=1282 RepID=UPI001EF7706A|nr:site-specific DNA-methyltransferase [Staphylococcus epidermidis]MCG2159935.1 site-specific DNA-methyltransferase [Staphylococcus epidermidis]MCG2261504.1 site-specific DNA-methyltransferase [Staphylococcus epidermidis]MCG7830982.1 site-specific DNA-methyltransferase [Staphylococcus epidermidis]MCG7837869.1 site-specific DNA-methyltransferase [Staphylococcus epidermidis]MCG7847431.1 site-specific DNA-methyltransferase [Staphylococcus epidermidis]